MEKKDIKRSEIKSIIEAIMFSYGEPLSIKDLNLAINEELAPKEIEIMLDILIEEYKENNRGINIIKLGDKWTNKKENSESSYTRDIDNSSI